jgi:hypothetical protein
MPKKYRNPDPTYDGKAIVAAGKRLAADSVAMAAGVFKIMANGGTPERPFPPGLSPENREDADAFFKHKKEHPGSVAPGIARRLRSKNKSL